MLDMIIFSQTFREVWQQDKRWSQVTALTEEKAFSHSVLVPASWPGSTHVSTVSVFVALKQPRFVVSWWWQGDWRNKENWDYCGEEREMWDKGLKSIGNQALLVVLLRNNMFV